MKLREARRHDAAAIVRKAVESSPRTVHTQVSSGSVSDKPIPFTLPQALAHKIQCKMSKDQYIYNRRNLCEQNCKVFPSYDKLAAYKVVIESALIILITVVPKVSWAANPNRKVDLSRDPTRPFYDPT